MNSDENLALKTKLRLEDQDVWLESNQPEAIDYWEVDPAWDGKVFRSACQAIRPRKEGLVTTRLHLPSAKPELPIRARVVDINGNTCILKLQR
jgi:hypothetical protein